MDPSHIARRALIFAAAAGILGVAGYYTLKGSKKNETSKTSTTQHPTPTTTQSNPNKPQSLTDLLAPPGFILSAEKKRETHRLASIINNNWTIEQLHDRYGRFAKFAHNSVMTKEDLIKFLELDPKDEDTQHVIDSAFKAFDLDRSGTLDFMEFMIWLTVVTVGTPEQKLEYVFRVADENNNHYITREDLTKITRVILTWHAHHHRPAEFAMAAAEGSGIESPTGVGVENRERPKEHARPGEGKEVERYAEAAEEQEAVIAEENQKLGGVPKRFVVQPSPMHRQPGAGGTTPATTTTTATVVHHHHHHPVPDTTDALLEDVAINNMTEKIVDNVFQLIDTDHDGKLSQKEFIDGMLKHPVISHFFSFLVSSEEQSL